jgi:hypothetical protein
MPTKRRNFACVLVVIASVLVPCSIHAQVIDVHVIHVPADSARSSSLGLGFELGAMTNVSPVVVWGALAGDYQRQSHLGPGQWRVAANLRVLPPTDRSFIPYLGGSVSANQSGGQQSLWQGTRLGLEALAGLLITPSRTIVGLRLEERYGYVQSQPHAFATQLGLALHL